MLAHVVNQGNVGKQNGNVVNENVQENVGNVIVNSNRVGCSYKEFLACNPKEFDGKGGVVVLTRWIEKMESVQNISGCSVDQKVKYNVGSFVEDFCPSHELQKLETEFWNYAMVGAGHVAYTDRFHELARLVPHLVTPESMMIERYVYGIAPQIRGMVAATELNIIQKDKNGRDDNKRTGTGNAFATIAKPVGRENTGPKENRPNQVAANNGGQGRGNQGNQARGRAFMLGADEAHQDPNIVTGIEPSELGFKYEIEIASEQLVEID
ncbi:hypothetical protein Tco_1574448, partial [Tanacetum coccineum]